MNRLESAILASSRKPLLGASIYFYNPIFVEMAAHLGFDVIWIEMEHAFITFAEAADLCRMATGHKLLTMIRIPDSRRETVLKAAECGPDIIDLPMVNSAAQIRELLNWALFPPAGHRGFFSVSRSLHYGLVENVSAEQQKLNQELSLLVQVETAEALNQIEEFCSIDGVNLFIGPADLSASLGVPGQTTHPKVIEAIRHVVATAKRFGKRVATAVNHNDAGPWIELGVDLVFCANDIVALRTGAATAIQETRRKIAEINAGSGGEIDRECKASR